MSNYVFSELIRICNILSREGYEEEAEKLKAFFNIQTTSVINGNKEGPERAARLNKLIRESGYSKQEIDVLAKAVKNNKPGSESYNCAKDRLWFAGMLVKDDGSWELSSSANTDNISPYTKRHRSFYKK